MAAEVLRLQTNVPEIIALQWADGLPCHSPHSGDQVRFTLTDGRVLYVAPFVADKIRAAGITANAPFQICKREVARGNRRSIEYEIQPLGDTGAPAGTSAPVHNQSEQSHQAIAPNGHINGNGNGHPPAAPAAAPDPIPTLEEAAAKLLERTGKRAFDAAMAVERYAQEKGLAGFTFGADNVQRIWMTLYIQSARNGGR
jgi:hypothetical protein